jgi:hypothetical protein
VCVFFFDIPRGYTMPALVIVAMYVFSVKWADFASKKGIIICVSTLTKY